MIHEAWGGALGDAETMRQQADVLDQISGAYRRTYAVKSGKDEETVAALMRAETWFDADMAVSEGFASETAEPAEIRAFAAFDPNRYAAAPAAFCGLVRAARDTVPVAAPVVSNPPAISPAVAKEIGMSESIAPAGGNAPAPSAAPAKAVAVQPISASVAELEGIAGRNGLPADFIVAQIKAGATREAALEAALEAVAARSPAPIMPNSSVVSVIRDERDTLRARWTGALSAQLSNQAPPAESREFANMGFHGLMREIAVANGVKDVHRMSGADLAEMVLSGRINAQHSTSDFPLILVNSANKSVQGLFGQYPNTWASWTREVDVADFKTITSAFAGQFPEVAAISEGAPYTYGSIAEEGQTYAVQERGRLVALTRQALEPQRMVLDQGEVPVTAGTVFVDCTASAVEPRPTQPIFQDGRIVLQIVRLPQPTFSAALIAWVETHGSSDKHKNALCAPVALPDTLAQYPGAQLGNMMNQFAWSQDKKLRKWIRECRLDGFGKVIAAVTPEDTAHMDVLAQFPAASMGAVANIRKRLLPATLS
jgi:hypothetical protein